MKLSKRAGDIIELRGDVLDEVGPDATRLTYLLQSIDTQPDLRPRRRGPAQSMDNPVFYVQMAHARLPASPATPPPRASTARRSPTVDLGLLVHERELDILAHPQRAARRGGRRRASAGRPTRSRPGCASWPAPFHGFYHDCYVMGDDVAPELTQARLWLVEAARIGLAIGLDLLGVTAPEPM